MVTRAGKLKARYVIHAVGPVYHGLPEDAKRLASAYRESLLRAEELRLSTVAFPSLSTGAYGYPVAEAALIALEAVAGFLGERAESVKRVRFVLFSDPVLHAYQEALAEIAARG